MGRRIVNADCVSTPETQFAHPLVDLEPYTSCKGVNLFRLRPDLRLSRLRSDGDRGAQAASLARHLRAMVVELHVALVASDLTIQLGTVAAKPTSAMMIKCSARSPSAFVPRISSKVAAKHMPRERLSCWNVA